METSFKIAEILDIPIKIHFSFIVILALFVWVFSFESFQIFDITIGYGTINTSIVFKAILGLLLSILLFVCVLLHELGHSYVTQKSGFKINGITLFIFGGASQMKETPREPNTEIKIASAGPGVSFLLGCVFYFNWFFKTEYFFRDIFNQLWNPSFL